jgi:hypothetical protein
MDESNASKYNGKNNKNKGSQIEHKKNITKTLKELLNDLTCFWAVATLPVDSFFTGCQ